MKKKIIILIILFISLLNKNSFSEIIDEIRIDGNQRVSDETILMFSEVAVNDEVNQKKINLILKNLYDSNFFDNVSVKLENNTLMIIVKELPVINEISINGVKAKKIKS